ncbi:MAG: endonuclease VIII [Pseudomonadota bacterium]
MPEGPEIRRAADVVAKYIEHQVVKKIYFAHEHLKNFEKTLLGLKVIKVSTRGKAMLCHFDNGLSIYSHNQLYGRWYCLEHGQQIETKRSLRLSITTTKGVAQLYSASDIGVLNSQEIKLHPLLSRMGPDVLDSQLTSSDIIQRLNLKKFKFRQLGQILTDQAFIAGIGNYLRCEILFICGLHPKVKALDCSKNKLKQLARKIIDLPRQSYIHQGITNNLVSAQKMMDNGVSFEQARFYVFRREDLSCYRCQTAIVKTNTGQACFLCPECQSID